MIVTSYKQYWNRNALKDKALLFQEGDTLSLYRLTKAYGCQALRAVIGIGTGILYSTGCTEYDPRKFDPNNALAEL